jgi:ATP-dependent DNA helicase RecG
VDIRYQEVIEGDISNTVQARIYDDKLSIWNEGPLPQEIPDLNAPHASVPRNRLIADTCFKAGYIDPWGRRYRKNHHRLHRARLPRSKLRSHPHGNSSHPAA